MDTSGNIYELKPSKSEEDYKKQLRKAEDVIITEQQKEFLEHFHPSERYQLHKDLMAKNHSAKRRAAKKMAKASRQRNRKG